MPTYEWVSYQINPTVQRWNIAPEFSTAITEFGSPIKIRRQRWNQPRRRFQIQYRTPVLASSISGIKDFFIARKGMWESFDLYVAPLGTTHSVTFTTDTQNFSYFATVLAKLGTVDFQETVLE